jgi:hypothetical protein
MPKDNLQEKTKLIELKPFPYDLKLIVTTDVAASEKKLRLKYNDICSKPVATERTGAMALHSRKLDVMHIIMPYRCDVGYIAHEVWHIVRALLLYSGATLDNEVVAYYIGWLVREATVFNFKVSKAKEKLDKQPVIVVE